MKNEAKRKDSQPAGGPAAPGTASGTVHAYVAARAPEHDDREMMRAFFEATPTLLVCFEVVFGDDGKPIDLMIVDANPAYQRFLGLADGSVIGRCFKEILPDVERKWLDYYAEVVRTRQPTHFEDYNAARAKWFEVFAMPYRSNRILVASTEITDRKQAEKQVQQHAAELEAFIRCLPDGAMLHDETGRGFLINDMGRKILGPTELGLLGDRIGAMRVRWFDGTPMTPENSPAGLALRGETVRDMRYWMTPEGGREIMISACATAVFGPDGRVLGSATIFRDVTDQAEEEQRRAEMHDREHRIAILLQEAILPRNVPGKLMGYEIAVRYCPASKEADIGGDFYDAFDLGDGRFAVVVGDVVGKGLQAAMRVAAARHTIRSYAYDDPRPSRVLTMVNKALCKDSGDECQMLTLFYAVLEPEFGGIVYANAGHVPPLICSAEGACVELTETGIPIGLVPEFEYEQHRRPVHRDDLIVIVTDGITESRTGTADLFGSEGVRRVVEAGRHGAVSNLAADLLAASNAHASGEVLDDSAVVVIRQATDI